MASLSDHLDLQTLTPEGAEGVLQQLAQALAPADPELRALTRSLAETEDLEIAVGAKSAEDLANHRAQAALRKAEARYRALVEQIPAVTFMAPLDGSTTELYVSPQIEMLLGFSAKEWLDNPILWYQQLHPDDQERWQTDFARTLNSGEHFRSTYRFLARDGHVVWVHGEAQVVADDVGRPLFLQGVAFDITELKRAEERLQQVNAHLGLARDQALAASRAKSAFLANMSHELRTPLHAILGFTEMLQEDALDGGQESFLPDLEKISSSAKHLVGLIGNILDLSKIEAGKMRLFLETFDAGVMLEEVVQTVLPLIEKSGNSLELRRPPSLGLMHADATKVRQVLLNLLSNAAKFTENGTVFLEAARVPDSGGEQLRIRVIDSGIGIEPEQRDKLFQSFSQVDDSSTRKYGGTGLGLAISQRFCQMMGGAITVDSEPGRGSTFTVHLPVHVTARSEAEEVRADAPPSEEPARDVPLLLVIDHDPQVLELMRGFLAREGMRVVTASSGAEGLRLAEELLPTAITLDVALPEEDSWKVLSTLKEDRTLADIPVVLCTLEGEQDRGYALGAADFLTRPIDWGRLSALLRKYRGAGEVSQILIVDDDPTNRELLNRMAAQQGWSVTEADNGWAALRCVAEVPPDLILLDLMMPQMDGFQLVRLLRKTQSGRAIPIVVVTAKDPSDEERQQLNAGVQTILQRGSFSRDELLQEIQGLVAVSARSRPPPPSPLANQSQTTEQGQAPSAALADLQQKLAQTQAERDAALAQGEEPPEWQVRQEELELEAEDLRKQLRDQQQTVELLRSEYEDAREQLEAMRDLPMQIQRLQAERDAALARPRQSAEPSEWASRQNQLEQQVSALIRLQRESQEQLEGLRSSHGSISPSSLSALHDANPRRHLGSGDSGSWSPAHDSVESSSSLRSHHSAVFPRPAGERPPPLPTPPAPIGPRPTNVWYIVYQEEEGGDFLTLTASTEEIRQWIRRGQVDNLLNVHASRAKGGPFDPLTSYFEFRDLLVPLVGSPSFAAGLTRTSGRRLPGNGTDPAGASAVAQTKAATPVPTERGASRQIAEWIKMLLLIVAIVAAMIAGQFLFRSS